MYERKISWNRIPRTSRCFAVDASAFSHRPNISRKIFKNYCFPWIFSFVATRLPRYLFPVTIITSLVRFTSVFYHNTVRNSHHSFSNAHNTLVNGVLSRFNHCKRELHEIVGNVNLIGKNFYFVTQCTNIYTRSIRMATPNSVDTSNVRTTTVT